MLGVTLFYFSLALFTVLGFFPSFVRRFGPVQRFVRSCNYSASTLSWQIKKNADVPALLHAIVMGLTVL